MDRNAIVSTPRTLITWTPRDQWARIVGSWFGIEFGSGSRFTYARVLGLELIRYRHPRR